jgi:predicted RNase H-like nuclease
MLPASSILAIDIPIGIPLRGARCCDVETRRRLGPRSSSVFPAPIRAVLDAADYAKACAIREATEGKRMSRQAFAILPKIREVDSVLVGGNLPVQVRECHPEVSFSQWAGAPLQFPKKPAAGRAERAELIDKVWPGQRVRVSSLLPRGGFALDDLHDAFAALWTARRLHLGEALLLPATPEFDSKGLRMEIAA